MAINIIQAAKGGWIIVKNPKSIDLGASEMTGSIGRSASGVVLTGAYWTGERWVSKERDAKVFESYADAREYLKSNRHQMEQL